MVIHYLLFHTEMAKRALYTCAEDLHAATVGQNLFAVIQIFYPLVTVDVTELRPPANKLNKYLMAKL